ncbi:MAG: hypothetical protein KGL13_00620 [Gammaproteobacteria bacterium]|nr:hypothetical protein [Gammaproteobacteria bacterium]MDE2344947.1 hypothetical protein [Gammaproteobacteria bacterium]
MVAAAATLAYRPAWADDFIVYSPYVVQSQSEIEFRGHSYHDSNPSVGGGYEYLFSVAHAFTDWWKPEIYFADYEYAPGSGQYLKARELENTFQLTPAGKYWADAGFLAAYEYRTQDGKPNAVEFGPLLEKHAGRLVQRLNFIWEKEVGFSASRNYEFRGAYSLSYQWHQAFAPGIEVYYRPADDAHQIGPVFYGELPTKAGDELEYSAGVVFGLNQGASNQTFVFRLEYEFF